MKEKLKNNKVIAGIAAIVVIVIALVVFVFMNQSSLKLKSKEVVIEYGNQISLKAEEYLDEKTDINIIADTRVTTDAKNEGGKEYPGVGEYTVTLSYKDEIKKLKVNVVDTTKPKFKDFKDTIETVKDVKPVFNKLYIAEDLSKVEITVADENVKYDTVGEYKATVKATDTSKNEVSKEITVKVIEPTIKLDKSTSSLYIKETVVLKAEIKGKEDKATFKSSDSNIASVDTDGKVTAKKKGTVTITAEANGVKAECKITVKETPKGSTTETKKDSNGNAITVIKKKNGTVSDLIVAAKKYIGQSLWCGELIDQAFSDSNCDPNRYRNIGNNFMDIRSGDIVYYNNHVFLALGSPQKESHSSISFKPEANMQELYLIEGGVTDGRITSTSAPHKVIMGYGFFQMNGYRFSADTDENCKLKYITRYK